MQLTLCLSSSFQVSERYLLFPFLLLLLLLSLCSLSSSFSSFPTCHNANNGKTTIFSASVCRATALLNLPCHQVSWRETQRKIKREKRRRRRRRRRRRKVISTEKTAGMKKTRHYHRYRFYLFARMNRQHMCSFFRVYETITINRFLPLQFVYHRFLRRSTKNCEI